MITEAEAREIVLRTVNDRNSEPFVVSWCELAPDGSCWVLGANSEAYVLHGDVSRAYVGVSAYLVDIHSGLMETVPSGQAPEQFLQDRADARLAGDSSYVLVPKVDATDKHMIVRLHQVLGVPLAQSRQMLSPGGSAWLTGIRRELLGARDLLANEGVPSEVELHPEPGAAVEMTRSALWWHEVRELLRTRASRS